MIALLFVSPIQLMGVIGVILLGMATIGTMVQGPSEATSAFAQAGLSAWALAAALGAMLWLLAVAQVKLETVRNKRCQEDK